MTAASPASMPHGPPSATRRDPDGPSYAAATRGRSAGPALCSGSPGRMKKLRLSRRSTRVCASLIVRLSPPGAGLDTGQGLGQVDHVVLPVVGARDLIIGF